MPSTQTRTKLKAFQFIEGAPTIETAKGREAEKENLPVMLEKAVETPKATKVTKQLDKAQKTPKPPSIITCPPPSTPATTRLPLADLVGNIDDSSRHVPKPVVSPEEQLIWRGSQPVNTPLPRKNKKRARSSSPVAPSQEDHRFDVGNKDITTPQADPAMELWSRYTNNKGTPSANKSVAFAHLINESSPRSTDAAGSVSGLRRWASCGHEFPASNRKRRRTHGVFQGDKHNSEDVFAAAPSSDGMMLGQPAKTNIANMVQLIRECTHTARSRLSTQLPSSSSPLPDAGERHAPSSGSPLQRRVQEQDQQTSETLQGGKELADNDENKESDLLRQSFGSSDDFGDDDFDSEMVDALDISPQETTQPPVATSYVDIPTEPLKPPPQPPQPPEVTAIDYAASDDDEFGMDDEEDFAADLEHVVSLYDARSVEPSNEDQAPFAEAGNAATTESAVPVPVISLVDDESDEFGEDIDVDEFAAAEVAATQTPANTVRRTQTFP
jgi:DNA replication ATP-dependent helicase Dna2